MIEPGHSCILIPYASCSSVLQANLEHLLEHSETDTTILLIDDNPAGADSLPAPAVVHPRVVCLRNTGTRGPAGARNRGIQWCREHGVALVIFLDSDCVPGSDLVREHVAHHRAHPEAVCIGGAIEGFGRGIWAELDKVASWFTSLPQSPPRVVNRLYHIPTTNMSIDLRSLPITGDLFDERLRTGEDVQFVRRLLKLRQRVCFFPTPVVQHHDRETFRAFLCHQYRWGLHTYCVRFGGSDRLSFRLPLAFLLVLALPLFAAAATVINLIPWLRTSPLRSLVYVVPLYLLYLLKGLAVAHGIIRPCAATRERSDPR